LRHVAATHAEYKYCEPLHEDLLHVLAWVEKGNAFAEVFWLPERPGYSGGTAPASNRLALDEDEALIAVLMSRGERIASSPGLPALWRAASTCGRA
jgi:hypothetical protein